MQIAKENLDAISTLITKEALNSGLMLFEGCRYECHVQIVLGPDGKPMPSLVCGMVC